MEKSEWFGQGVEEESDSTLASDAGDPGNHSGPTQNGYQIRPYFGPGSYIQY